MRDEAHSRRIAAVPDSSDVSSAFRSDRPPHRGARSGTLSAELISREVIPRSRAEKPSVCRRKLPARRQEEGSRDVKARTRRKLEMGARALLFCRLEAESSRGYAIALA